MTKRNLPAGLPAEVKRRHGKAGKIIYWIATAWLALGMLSTGAVQLLKTEKEVTMMTSPCYPVYFLTITGVWKNLGVAAVLRPKFPLLKECLPAGLPAEVKQRHDREEFMSVFSLPCQVLSFLTWSVEMKPGKFLDRPYYCS